MRIAIEAATHYEAESGRYCDGSGHGELLLGDEAPV
jgi:hypothetical protein